MNTFARTTRNSLLFAGFSMVLAACGGTDPAEVIDPAAPNTAAATDERAFFEALLSEPFDGVVQTSGAPVDFAAAFADLPEGTRIETGSVSLDAETGATRVEDFALVYDLDGTGVGLQADEVLFYGFDPDAIANRIRGTNLESSHKVADRIELTGVKSVGMEAVSKLFLDSYVDAIDDFTPIEDDIVTDLNRLDIFNYNFEMNKLLIDGFVLEPFVFAAVPETPLTNGDTDPTPISDATDLDERQALQMVGAAMRAFTIDAVVYEGMSLGYQMRDDDIEMSMDMSLALAGMRGYNRGDLDFSGSWDASFSGNLPFPADPSGGSEMRAVPMVGAIERSTVSGMRLARAFEALADWQLPETDETDLLALGQWELANYTMDLADKPLFKVSEFSFDTDFYWLLPTKFDLTLSDTGYNLGNLFQVMTEELGEEIAPGITREKLAEGLAIVEQYGFDCLCGDYDLELTWDETTGDISYLETSQFADAFSGRTFADLGFPTPERMTGLIGADDAEAQFEQAFKEDFAFRGAEAKATDIGGLTNLFEMLHAIGQAFPEQDGMAILAYNDAAQLRALAVNSVNGMKPMVRQQVPEADPWMEALASFLEEGGTLTFAANPAEPITVPMIESMDAEGVDPEPEELIELLGLTVTHTK